MREATSSERSTARSSSLRVLRYDHTPTAVVAVAASSISARTILRRRLMPRSPRRTVYPTPRTVWISLLSPGSSSLRRRYEMYTARFFESGPKS